MEKLTPLEVDQRKILIVGGSGYIGTVLTEHLLSQEYGVRNFDNLVYAHDLATIPFLKNSNYQYVNGTITDTEKIASSLEGVTDVVLLAGLVGDPITAKYPELAGDINDGGYKNILSLLNGRGLNKVIFVSTCSNYGLIDSDQLADEEFDLNPLSLYAKSKVQIEKNLLSMEDGVDFTPTILRFATAFGMSPRMRFDLTISQFVRAMYLGEDLVVFDADTWRPYCHVQDFSTVIRGVLEAPVSDVEFQVFNAGGNINNFTKRMIVEAIQEELPKATVSYQEHGGDPRNYRVNFEKIGKALFFEPKYTVRDGIRELVSAMDNGLFTNIDEPKSFYGNWTIEGA